ncbi:MAG: DinB family protein [Actinobacteria bacterium]|nr:MAG: DinB family protein [Actinomycetota bacterium]
MPQPVPTRTEAIRILERDRRTTLELIHRLPDRAITTRGLGGGDWSPKDLIGHLESWEQHALDALEAWARGEPAPSDVALRNAGLNALNRAEVERKARWSAARSLKSATDTHARLVAAIRALSDDRWLAPPTRRARRPLARSIGGILGGPSGAFRHDAAHLPDLKEFVERYGS